MLKLKKQRLLRISCIAIIACLMVSIFPTSTFAANSNNQQITTSQKSSYFDEKTALAFGQSFINDTISFDHTTSWTKNTQPSEIIKTYDTDNNVNAYIVNLKTNNKPTGYLVIEAFTSEKPNIMEFGYSGVYYLTDKKFENLKNKKIVYTGNRNFFVESSGQYYTAEDNKKIASTKATLKNDYLNKAKLENSDLKNEQISKTSQVKALTTTVNQYVTVSGLSSFTPYTMNEFAAACHVTDHCGVTAGMNLLKYWAVCRKVVPLFINYDKVASFNSLASNMKLKSPGGVGGPESFSGLQSYISKNHLEAPLGNDYRDNAHLNWATIKAEIDHNIPFIMGADCHTYDSRYPLKSYHEFFAVGYQNRSDGCYVRVGDEWNTSTDHFYQYLYSNVPMIWYYRWA